ncbi:hypothetical protein HYDPIDRAFT_117846 [Hydnomerulius pinastri MD-312]|uniref:G domain-containing protein n=1 Tax=Hydnomerulius pinastri MD-312 TaxID=994086 RepID=A0A0C9W1Y0_9AGAM|nr:hypothetical protein HYDPIDRAFT_117846 [Hydnomerulius pinastri MD-312]
MTLICGICPQEDGLGSPPLIDNDSYVVVVFGHTGVGVSSLINLIAGCPVSDSHADVKTCTRNVKGYPVPLFNKRFYLFEVPGFGGDLKDAAIIKLIQNLEKNHAIDLFIYCFRKKRDTLMPNALKQLRDGIPSAKGVPLIGVVTELEKIGVCGEDMEDWWTVPSEEGGDTNGERLEAILGLTFDAHACVTTLPPKDVDLLEGLRKRRMYSEEVVKSIVVDLCTNPKRTHERT